MLKFNTVRKKNTLSENFHRDKTNRRVHVLRGKGWKLQMDDSLPEEMKVGHDYWIPEMVYHRVIKGENELVLRIENI